MYNLFQITFQIYPIVAFKQAPITLTCSFTQSQAYSQIFAQEEIRVPPMSLTRIPPHTHTKIFKSHFQFTLAEKTNVTKRIP
jgi:hypothetical protein